LIDHHVERMEKQRRHERQAHLVERVGVPGSFDVLLGKGRAAQEHCGNKRFRDLIDSYQDEYNVASKYDKTAITEKMVDLVKQSSGQFWKEDGAGWVRAPDHVARSKVGHCFRDHKRIKEPKRKHIQR
jgi:hypothetical protein